MIRVCLAKQTAYKVQETRPRIVISNGMDYAKPLISVLLVSLLVAVASIRRGEKPWHMGPATALARLGFAVAKISILLLPLEWMQHLYAHAEPLAVSAKAVWLAALAMTCQLYLAISCMADVCIAVNELFGRSAAAVCEAPYRAGSFGGLWRRMHLGLVRGDSIWHLMPVLLLFGGLGALWRGGWLAVPVWMSLQAVLVLAEKWRGKSLFAPLPLPLRVILVLLVLVVSNVLLIHSDLSLSMQRLGMIFAGAEPTLYSLLLDKRLAGGWQQIMLSLALLTSVGLPTVHWILQQPVRSWWVMGILLLPLSLLMALRESVRTPALVQHVAQWPVTWLFDEGNASVHQGYDGWLFPQRELDRLTLQRRGPGAVEALLKLSGQLKAANVPLLVVAVPAKAAMYPQQILRAEYPAPVQPPGFKARLEKLTAAGIEVLDPSQPLWDRLIRAEAFFANDSHWTPETMKEVATLTAKQIRQKWPTLHQAETPLIQASILDRSDMGDLAKALLPYGEYFFGEESAQLVSIRGLESDAKSPILLLGGELLRVFEAADASFGNANGQAQHAGFPTQLAALLGRPLDVRLAEDESELLSAETLATLAGKKKLVVVLLRADAL